MRLTKNNLTDCDIMVDPKTTLPAIPAEVIAKLMNTYKEEIETRCMNCIENIPKLIESAIDRRNVERQIRLRSQLKYLIGSLPGGVIVWIFENLLS